MAPLLGLYISIPSILTHLPDKDGSPNHRAITLNDIRLARVQQTATTTSNSSNPNGGGAPQPQQQQPGQPPQQQQQQMTQQQQNPNQQTAITTLQSQTSGTANNNNNNNSTNSTIITIKQEQLTSVDSLVGSFVDSTTFLPSPTSQQQQMVNPNMLPTAATTGPTGMSQTVVSGSGEVSPNRTLLLRHILRSNTNPPFSNPCQRFPN